MLAIFLAPVYILANVFTAYWLLRWMKEVHPLFRHPAVLGVILVLYAFFALSLLTSFLIKRDPVHRILKVISNCWLGMYLYFLGFTAILVLLRFIFAHTALTKTWLYSPMGLKAVGLGAILFVTGMCIYGMVHAVHIYTTRYEVPSKKGCTSEKLRSSQIFIWGTASAVIRWKRWWKKSMLRSRMSL